MTTIEGIKYTSAACHKSRVALVSILGALALQTGCLGQRRENVLSSHSPSQPFRLSTLSDNGNCLKGCLVYSTGQYSSKPVTLEFQSGVGMLSTANGKHSSSVIMDHLCCNIPTEITTANLQHLIAVRICSLQPSCVESYDSNVRVAQFYPSEHYPANLHNTPYTPSLRACYPLNDQGIMCAAKTIHLAE